MAIPERKACRECGEDKLAAEFFVNGDGRGRQPYLSAACRPCTKLRLQRWREANRERAREQVRGQYARQAADPKFKAARRASQRKHILMKRYAITIEQYQEMVERQGGVCAVCQRPETMVIKGTVASLAVDHDPVTERVRGLLCFDCNTGIGKLGHDPDVLLRAVEYLLESEPAVLADKED